MGVQTGRRTGYGWPVLTATTTGPLPRLRKWVIPGTGRHLILRDGSIGFLIVHFALWWHDRIHKLDTGQWDEWGWADRTVRGNATKTSEHAGGCAADLDATMHPWGVAIGRTFARIQIRRIRRRLKSYRTNNGHYVLGWGGDYENKPDGMHIEIARGATLIECERVARRLMNTPRGRRILAHNLGAEDVILS